MEPSTVAVDQVRVRMLPDGRLEPDQAALYTGYKSKTLAIWRSRKQGPAYVKIGNKIFYYREALDDFLRSRSASKASTPQAA